MDLSSQARRRSSPAPASVSAAASRWRWRREGVATGHRRPPRRTCSRRLPARSWPPAASSRCSIVEDLMQEGAPARIAEAALGSARRRSTSSSTTPAAAGPSSSTPARSSGRRRMTLNFTRQRQLTHRLLDQMMQSRCGPHHQHHRQVGAGGHQRRLLRQGGDARLGQGPVARGRQARHHGQLDPAGPHHVRADPPQLHARVPAVAGRQRDPGRPLRRARGRCRSGVLPGVAAGAATSPAPSFPSTAACGGISSEVIPGLPPVQPGPGSSYPRRTGLTRWSRRPARVTGSLAVSGSPWPSARRSRSGSSGLGRAGCRRAAPSACRGSPAPPPGTAGGPAATTRTPLLARYARSPSVAAAAEDDGNAQLAPPRPRAARLVLTPTRNMASTPAAA